MTNTSNLRKDCGFTLIELLAVIAIASILLVVALQGIKVAGSTVLQVGARQFANDLQSARQYAITKRVRVRVFLAVDPTILSLPTPLIDSNSLYRAYCIYAYTNNPANPSVTNFWRVTDWRLLPFGSVFSDLHIGSSYPWNTNSVGSGPLSGPRSQPTSGPQGSEFDTSVTVTDTAVNTNGVTAWGSGLDFLPTGQANSYLGIASIITRPGGVRLAQGGCVYSNGTWNNLLIQNTNNWVYIEFDSLSGRIRTRWADSY